MTMRTEGYFFSRTQCRWYKVGLYSITLA